MYVSYYVHPPEEDLDEDAPDDDDDDETVDISLFKHVTNYSLFQYFLYQKLFNQSKVLLAHICDCI